MISLLTFPKENYGFPFDVVAYHGSKLDSKTYTQKLLI